jgi:uncharacterized protein YbaR (Trm112 family)
VPIDISLLEILCCPAVHGGKACHGPLQDIGEGLQCQTCGLVYPIEDGIPVMLVERAELKTSAMPSSKCVGSNLA